MIAMVTPEAQYVLGSEERNKGGLVTNSILWSMEGQNVLGSFAVING
jgi:hypothetical protein